MTEWEAFAAALRASPDVSVVSALPDGCGWGDRNVRWLSLEAGVAALTCAAREGEVDCRQAAPRNGVPACEVWKDAPRSEVPPAMTALVSAWTSFPHLRVSPVKGGPGPGGALVVMERAAGVHVALRTEAGWRLSPDLEPADEETFRVQGEASFDASPLVGREAWGVVSTTFSGCGQLGVTDRALTVLAVTEGELAIVERRSLGSTWYVRDAAGHRTGGVALTAAPVGSTLRLDLFEDDPGTFPDEPAVRADVGVWTFDGKGLVRVP